MNELAEKEKFLEFLLGFVSDHKRALFTEKIARRTQHFTVVLEDIFQPHNASAVLRSCECFGIQDVHIIENANRFDTIETIALGSFKWLSLHQHNQLPSNTVACFDQLKKQGYKIVATTPHKEDTNLEDFDVSQKFALVFGQELRGITEEAMHHADAFLKVPMHGFTESLNISVCAAICIHHLRYKLDQSSLDTVIPYAGQLDILINWAKNVVKNSELLEAEFLKRE